MGMFTVEDPITEQYLKRVGFKKMNNSDKTIVYCISVKRKYDVLFDLNYQNRLIYYLKSSKKRNRGKCEFSVVFPKQTSKYGYRKHVIRKQYSANTENDMDLILMDIKQQYASLFCNCNIDEIQFKS